MSETLEQRIRRHAVESRDELVGFYATDIAELLDNRDADYARMVQAARDVVTEYNIDGDDYDLEGLHLAMETLAAALPERPAFDRGGQIVGILVVVIARVCDILLL